MVVHYELSYSLTSVNPYCQINLLELVKIFITVIDCFRSCLLLQFLFTFLAAFLFALFVG